MAQVIWHKWWVKTHPYEFVLIVMWVHLFPSRTQKLSTCTPTIVAGWLAVKIGNANTKSSTRKCGALLIFFDYGRKIVSCCGTRINRRAYTDPRFFRPFAVPGIFVGDKHLPHLPTAAHAYALLHLPPAALASLPLAVKIGNANTRSLLRK